MTAINKFHFDKTSYDLDINGKVFTIDFSDEKMLDYMDVADETEQALAPVSEQELVEMGREGRKEHFDKVRAGMKKIIEAFLGEGSFDEVYEMSGRSIVNLMDLVEHLMSLYNDQQSAKLEAKKQKYTKGKK